MLSGDNFGAGSNDFDSCAVSWLHRAQPTNVIPIANAQTIRRDSRTVIAFSRFLVDGREDCTADSYSTLWLARLTLWVARPVAGGGTPCGFAKGVAFAAFATLKLNVDKSLEGKETLAL
jgi:hypothetical protein